MSESGVLIALDGVDGAGNTTHSRRLSRWISGSLGLRTLSTKEPTTRPIGVLVRRYLRMRKTSIVADALLFAADRAEHVEMVLKPALAKGIVVVSDRYLESSIAYQSAQGLPIEWLVSINRHSIKPSLNFVLDIAPEKSLARKARLVEKFEEVTFLDKVRSILLNRAKSQNYPIIDTSDPLEQAQDRIRDIVKPLLLRKFSTE